MKTRCYMYDAEGRRVNKTSGGGSLDYLFDPAGRQIAEVGAGGVWDRAEIFVAGRHLATYNGGAVYFHNADWIGTERVRTNLAGTIAESCQSLPFGDGQVCNGGDFSPMHFTGKPRDTESGLDDFPARYYSSTQGRWISADWSATPEAVPYSKLGDPQTLDLYAYVGNNPVTDGDPSGHLHQLTGEAEEEIACSAGEVAACDPSEQASQQAQNKKGDPQKAPADVQKDIKEGTPPAANMASCPNCKYYPKDVQQAVHTHEREHMKQMIAMGLVEGAACSAIASCHRLMELDAYRAEAKFVNQRLSELDAKQAKGSLSSEEQTSQRVLKTMKAQEDNFFRYPSLLP